MWIDNLTPQEARNVLGPDWQAIMRITAQVAAGRPAAMPAEMRPEEYEGSLYFYGPNGPAVYLFLRGLRDLYQPQNIIRCPEADIIRVPDRGDAPSPFKSRRWTAALTASGAQRRHDTLANVWKTGAKIGLDSGPVLASFLFPAPSGELAQPEKDLHFFLDMMPYLRCGQLPCGWEDATERPIVEWLGPDALAWQLQTQANRIPREHLWPTHAIGMRLRDEEALDRLAKDRRVIILVRDSSPAMPQYIGRPHHRPRPPYVPGIPRREPPHIALIAAKTAAALPSGFTIDPADGLIHDPAGNCFYDGIDLVGVYRMSDGDDGYSDALRHEMNQRLGEDLVQSGPSDRDDSTDEFREPRPPVTAFMPDRPPVRLLDVKEKRSLYQSFKIPWRFIYPQADAAKAIP